MLALVKAKREIGRSRWIKASVDGTVADPDGVVFCHELTLQFNIGRVEQQLDLRSTTE